ncbi:ComEA family DNA-binding protein [Salinibius halmophilus]|uniref:ComEA family DNA-binding protein n=1 Tax=Salinibius halmophilus TaxID=1853216 RepID=UPI0018F631E9|nr:helix-hairpin-helix domain-containing protein [Salinibius halmophilus]
MKKMLTLILMTLSLVGLSLPAMAAEDVMEETVAQLVTVNINEADAEMLADLLVGVGPAKAEAIVAYRTEFGPFANADELTNVRGIGQATVDKNRTIIEI